MKVLKGVLVLMLVMALMGCEPAVGESVSVEEDEVKHEIEVDRKSGFGNTWEIEVPKFND